MALSEVFYASAESRKKLNGGGVINFSLRSLPNSHDNQILFESAERLLSLGLFECDDHFVMELEALNDNYNLSIKYKFHISMELHNQVCEVMEVYFGEPEMVDYNLNTARNFKLIKGGKSK